MRKLASIQTVVSIAPIPGADKIEVATILDWHLVVKKGEFSVGDKCVYFEIDSVLPEVPMFEFLRPRAFRIRTVKMKGQISQGLAMPVSNFPVIQSMEIDTDVTEILGVKKYDPESAEEAKLIVTTPTNKVFKYMMRYEWFRNAYKKLNKKTTSFTSLISKTDETRVQSIGSIIRANAGRRDLYITEKIDGSSMTVVKEHRKLFNIFPINKFTVCSRNIALPNPDGSKFWKFVGDSDLLTRMRKIQRPIAIQGELAGPGIQHNKYGFKELRFFLFRAKWLDTGAYLTYRELRSIAILCEIELVPLLKDQYTLTDIVDDIVQMSIGKSVFAERSREGIVIRSFDQQFSFKAINPEFLLKE